ncbi:MAG: hypothetical protein MUC73_08020 [Cyclobacteriaceae bacterium]|nr:hypothetical protein [Cyclobacteriaceae bacterium]
MNKQILKFMLFISPLLFIVGCDDEEEIKPAPTLSVAGAPTSALPGDEISFEVTVTAPNGGEQLNAFVGATSIASIDLGGQTSSTQTIDYTIPANAVIGSTVVITLQATDSKNLSSQIANVSVQVNDPVIQIGPGNLTTQTLDPLKRYIIKGQTFVPAGVTLTIPAGTVILGDKATKGTLVVEKGGILNVNGTVNAPVVMTSAQNINERDKGDWGGLVLLGRAFTNQNVSDQNAAGQSPNIEGIDPPKYFGSNVRTNDAESSGTITYLRVEYAGIELSPNNETNSITLGGIGSGTTFENVQVSFGGDDGFEWFGGTVNGKYLISLSTWDDDFDVDYGYSGKVQFALAVRNPFYADQSQSNAFECDNGPQDTDTGAGTYTTGTFSNVTVYGPVDRTGRSISANNVHSMDLRRRTAVSIFNSVIGGFPTGLRFNQASVLAQYQGGTGVLSKNVLIAPTATRYAAGSGVDVAAVQAYWETDNTAVAIPANDANQTQFYTDLGLRIDNFFARYQIATYPTNPDFTLSSGTATLAAGADFTNPKLGGGFFTTTTYRGAFDTTSDWTDGWAEFRPISKVY